MKRTIALVLIAILAIGLYIVWRSIPSAIAKEVQSQQWTLVRLTLDGESVSLPQDAEITLRHMEKKRYVGNAAVNHYETHFDINRDGKITFSQEAGGVTEMAGPPHLMDFETRYLAAFWNTETANVSGSTLILEGPKIQLEYQGVPATPIDRSGSPDDTVSTTDSKSE